MNTESSSSTKRKCLHECTYKGVCAACQRPVLISDVEDEDLSGGGPPPPLPSKSKFVKYDEQEDKDSDDAYHEYSSNDMPCIPPTPTGAYPPSMRGPPPSFNGPCGPFPGNNNNAVVTPLSSILPTTALPTLPSPASPNNNNNNNNNNGGSVDVKITIDTPAGRKLLQAAGVPPGTALGKKIKLGSDGKVFRCEKCGIKPGEYIGHLPGNTSPFDYVCRECRAKMASANML